MSGLAGVIYPDIFQMTEQVKPMLQRLKHRGGDVQDVLTYKNAELGMHGGKLFADQNVIVGVDGNITPEEVAQGYAKWGKDFMKHLEGEFSIVLVDKKDKFILIVRDRVGVKPLYWSQTGNYFLFASELKALLAPGIISHTPALNCISSYLYFGFIAQDLSPIEGVNKLLPAHYLQYTFEGKISIVNYWSFSSFFHKERSEFSMETFETLLGKAVKARTPKDERVGVFVSEGSALISSHLPQRVEFSAENENLGHLLESIWHLDEPNADPAILSIWKMSEMASKETKRVFSATGSDELFARHNRYSIPEKREVFSFYKWLIPLFLKFHKPTALELLKHSRTKPWQFSFMSQNTFFTEKQMRAASSKLASVFDPEVFLHKFEHLPLIESHAGSYLYLDVKTRLPDYFCLPLDRLTSAHSLNWVAPYLDHHILEYMAGVEHPYEFVHQPERIQQWPEATELFKMLLHGTLVDTGLISRDWLEGHIGKQECAKQLWSILTLEIWFRLYINRAIDESAPKMDIKEFLLEC